MQLKLQTPQFCKTEYNRNKNKGAGETRSVDGQTLRTNLLNPNAVKLLNTGKSFIFHWLDEKHRGFGIVIYLLIMSIATYLAS